MSETLTVLEQMLISAARHKRRTIGPVWAPRTVGELNRHLATVDACQAFLEAYAPEYAGVREREKLRLGLLIAGKLQCSLTPAELDGITRDIEAARVRLVRR